MVTQHKEPRYGLDLWERGGMVIQGMSGGKRTGTLPILEVRNADLKFFCAEDQSVALISVT